MKPIFFFAAILAGFSFVSCTPEKVEPAYRAETENKQVIFQVYSRNDFSDPSFADHKVRDSMGIARIKHDGSQKVELDTTLGWISFRDIPSELAKLKLERTVKKVDLNRESVSVSYSFTTSINGYIASTGRNDFINRWEKSKQVDITF